MNVKVAVVVLGVVVVLFAAALAVGGSREEGTADEEQGGVVDRLGEVAGNPAGVPLEDLTADCASPDDPTLLTFAGDCTIVARNEDGLRVIRLQTDGALGVEAPAPEGDTEVDADFDPGEEAAVAVGEGETDIELSCDAGPGAECLVRIVV
jgi:hypothetical protein